MLELTNLGFSKEKAYRITQKHAQNSWNKDLSLYESLVKDKVITSKVSKNKLEKMFNVNYHIRRIDLIFNRIFK